MFRTSSASLSLFFLLFVYACDCGSAYKSECGNGRLDYPEQCDDGNQVDWDGCTGCLYSEFEVNQPPDQSDQAGRVGPDVAVAPDGSFVVVWLTQGAGASTVSGRCFDENGVPRGDEFVVNEAATLWREHARVDMDAAGNFVVVWDERPEENNTGLGVHAKLFDEACGARGSAFRLDETDALYQPSVDMIPDGRFVVVWRTYYRGVEGRRFDSLGNPVGDVFHAGPDDWIGIPEVAATDAGMVLTWIEMDNWPDSYAQLFDADANPVTAPFMVNEHKTGSQTRPTPLMRSDGSFVLTWESEHQDEPAYSSYGVYARTYSAAGEPLVEEFRVNTSTRNDQKNNSTDMMASGNFVVVWGDNSFPDEAGVRGQRFDVMGAPVGVEFGNINLKPGCSFMWPRVGLDAVGRMVVVWQTSVVVDDRSWWRIHARLCDAAGNPRPRM